MSVMGKDEDQSMERYWKEARGRDFHGPDVYLSRPDDVRELFFAEACHLLGKESRVLELGCNVGGNLDYLFRQGYVNLTGVDISKYAIEKGSNYFPHLRNRLLVSDALVFLKDMQSESFDLIITVGVIQNLPLSHRSVFQEMGRVSSRYILIKEPDPLSLNHGIFNAWDYDFEFKKTDFYEILRKRMPSNIFGIPPDKLDVKIPTLRLYAKILKRQ